MKFKIFLAIFILILIINQFTFHAFAQESLDDFIDKNIDSLDTENLEEFINKNLQQNISIKDYLIKVINGEINQSFYEILNEIIKYLKMAITSYLPSIILIIFICFLQSILNSLTSSFLSKETDKICNFVTFSAILTIVLNLIINVFNLVHDLVFNISNFMELTFPIILTLISSLGGVNSQLAFKPYMSILTNVISNLCIKVVLPLLIGSIIVMMVTYMSDRIKLDKLSNFLKSIAKWVLVGIFSIFITTLSIQGLTSGVIDTISIKTAKGAIDNYIPILGEYLSEGYDLVLGSIVLIKNSFGLISVIILLLIILNPVIEIIVLSLLLKFTAAVVEPVDNNQVSSFLYKISNSLIMFISVIVGMFFMFCITIMLAIYSFNLGV